MEQATAASIAEKERKQAGGKVDEHDLREEEFGIPDEDLERYGGERYPAHEYLILSTAGKPVFWSKIKQSIQDEEDQMEATRVGLLQAIISNYAENNKKKLYETSAEVLELPKTGKTTFLLRPPLYLVAVSYWDEPNSTLRNHLEYLHQAVISLVSASKLNKLFDRAANFDLKRLLQGTDNILDSLLTRLQLETIAMRGALQPLRLNAAIRHDVGAALIPTRSKQARPQDALYAVLLTRNGIVTLARRRKHSIHPVDCHLLVNTVLSTNALKEGGTQSWVPICLPKFAPQGFLYAHVSFLDDEGKQDKNEKVKGDTTAASASNRHPDLGLVLVTANPDGFDDMSAWRDRIVDEAATRSTSTNATTTSIRYSADELGIAGLRHFCFKWRSNVQSTSSSYEDPYTPGTDDHRRLLYLYGLAYEYQSMGIGTSQGRSTTSTHVIRTQNEAILAWSTPPFELYICASPHIPNSTLINMAKSVVKWVKQEEHQLFIVSAPIF
ncbi:DUF254-domain-containing protein [Meira miltonrushii]|uniref:Vacuolar fusion protein MON1 n=1 Tax=Meira miltonrushii TaxID=1280837 RepID=A0A316V385_9BASI|nr:DUF254-domain-containing protein [Meira miltonrushii]PWN32019.1 DUF254-domain-containing protein [Meira miltonrushii]